MIQPRLRRVTSLEEESLIIREQPDCSPPGVMQRRWLDQQYTDASLTTFENGHNIVIPSPPLNSSLGGKIRR